MRLSTTIWGVPGSDTANPEPPLPYGLRPEGE